MVTKQLTQTAGNRRGDPISVALKKEGIDWRQEKRRKKEEEDSSAQLTPLHKCPAGVIFLDSAVGVNVGRS